MRYLTLNELCKELSISPATGRNWLKLGKISPAPAQEKTPLFSPDYVSALKASLASGENGGLKSRRNKTYISGNSPYGSYVSETCRSLHPARQVAACISEQGIPLTGVRIQALLADCALQLLLQRLGKSRPAQPLLSYLRGEFALDGFEFLIDGFLPDREDALAFLNGFPQLFTAEYFYEESEDVLGLLYLSCQNIGRRKASGAYYTPTALVKKSIQALFREGPPPSAPQNGRLPKILDPCCGTGNFLLQLSGSVQIGQLYGMDVDPIGIQAARANLALRYRVKDEDFLRRHFAVRDFLAPAAPGQEEAYDFIIGNPPWGYAFSEEENRRLRAAFQSARGKRVESYDVFTEQAVSRLAAGGSLSFLLPEAILNVRSHLPIRRLLLERCSFRYLEFLGSPFDGVQCPSILLQARRVSQEPGKKDSLAEASRSDPLAEAGGADSLAETGDPGKTDSLHEADSPGKKNSLAKASRSDPLAVAGSASCRPGSCLGMTVRDGARAYSIQTERNLQADCFSFSMTDGEYRVFQKIARVPNAASLKGNAVFALGIVTGDNRRFLSGSPIEGSEPILTGADLFRFWHREPARHIVCQPEKFQQAAPMEYYRSPEKLLYRFICGQLVFSYDGRGLLPLNSCNVLIPGISGLDAKYVMAVLNSRAAQFFFRKKFRSVKVLRSHLEQIPIPLADEKTQADILRLADKLIYADRPESAPDAARQAVYDALDEKIAAIFQLSSAEYGRVKSSLADQGLFL